MPLLIEKHKLMYSNLRKSFERRWYDNNLFDDGYHFRYVSRTTGKVVDLSNRASINAPQRAIPKASRQIRGVANLLMAPEYTPVVYPEKVSKVNYQSEEEYQKALEIAKFVAQKSGHWITEEFKNQDIEEKLIQLILLACKHGVSFLEVWPDAVEEKIRSAVHDAFEIYLMGSLTDMYQSPSIIKAVPQLISVIKANEEFDKEQLLKISPDNKYASSEIKEAYMNSRYGSQQASDETATLILNECFIKEYLTEENREQISQMARDEKVLEGKSVGDVVMRHTYVAGGVWLLDEYIDLEEYPFIDVRLEPGPIYQVPLIERFIPANKTLDLVMSRVERYLNTMVTGTWLTRAGEDLQITNIAGGQKLEYKNTKPEQAQITPLPNFVFNFINKVEALIDEQGASSASLNQLPEGVKSGVAIESVKATEYANLKIPSMMVKGSVKRIAEKLLDIGDRFIDPQTVYYLEKGEPQYFDVIGSKGIEIRQKLGLPVDAIPIKKEYRVDIEVESGLGFTMEGKKQTIQQISDFMINLSEKGLLTQDAVKVIVRKFLDTYQYGATQEFMEALDTGTQASPLTEEQLQAIKIAVLEVLNETGLVGPEADQKMVDSTKVGVVEAMKDTGMLGKPQEVKEPSQSISFKDLPPEGQAQLAAKAGIVISPEEIEAQKESNATSQG